MSVLLFLVLAAGLVLNGVINGFNLTLILQAMLSVVIAVLFVLYKMKKLFFRRVSASLKSRAAGSSILVLVIIAAAAVVYLVGLTQPESIEVRNALESRKASALINTGKFSEAAELLEARDNNGLLSTNDRINLGSAYLNLGKIDLAKTQYNLALEEMPADSVCYFNLGLAYMEDGDLTMAMKCFEKAGQYNPQLWISFLYRGAILRLQGSVRPALEMYIKVDHRNPGVAFIKYMIARLTYELNDVENAKVRIEAALDMDQEPAIREELEAMLEDLSLFKGGD